MSDIPVYIDGYYGVPRLISRTPREYPFADNGDNTTAVYSGTYLVDQSRFVPTRRGTEDPLNPGFYLLEETKPDIAQGDIAPFVRTYGNIPLQQIVPGSMFITKPDVSAGASIGLMLDYSILTVASGGVTIAGPLSNPACYEYLGRIYGGSTFFSDLSGVSSIVAATGGTFTLSYKGSTTGALNWNDAGATIAAALNALASVVAEGLTFSVVNTLNTLVAGPRLTLTVTVGTTSTAVTMDAALLTPAAAKTAFGLCVSLTSQYVAIGARVTLTAHGFSGALALAAYQSSAVARVNVYPPSLWSVVDANTIAFAYQGVQNGDGAFTKFGQAISTYSSGTSLTRVKSVSTFYLPGVSPGISSIDDIPIPTYQGTPSGIVNAIIAGATTLNYEVGDLKQWRGPILVRTITTLNPTQLA